MYRCAPMDIEGRPRSPQMSPKPSHEALTHLPQSALYEARPGSPPRSAWQTIGFISVTICVCVCLHFNRQLVSDYRASQLATVGFFWSLKVLQKNIYIYINSPFHLPICKSFLMLLFISLRICLKRLKRGICNHNSRSLSTFVNANTL